MEKNHARQIIDALGSDALCAALGIKPSTVEKAKYSGVMPASWFRTVERMCSERGALCYMDAFAWRK